MTRINKVDDVCNKYDKMEYAKILRVEIQGAWLDLSDGKIFTTMEWLMVFVKVPL